MSTNRAKFGFEAEVVVDDAVLEAVGAPDSVFTQPKRAIQSARSDERRSGRERSGRILESLGEEKGTTTDDYLPGAFGEQAGGRELILELI